MEERATTLTSDESLPLSLRELQDRDGSGLALRWLRPGRARTRRGLARLEDPADLMQHLDEVGVRVEE